MRLVIVATFAFAAWIVAFGSPFSEGQPELAHHYGSPEPILPMTFAHIDHETVRCIDCHHNFVDDTGGDICMGCHVTDADVWPLFEEQFHDLCRGCHMDLAAKGEDSGPVRHCMGCHLKDQLP